MWHLLNVFDRELGRVDVVHLAATKYNIFFIYLFFLLFLSFLKLFFLPPDALSAAKVQKKLEKRND